MKDLKYFKVLFRYFKKDKFKLFIFIFLTSLICFQQMLYPIFYSKALTFLSNKDWSNFLIFFLIWEGMAVLINIIFTYPKDYCYNYLEAKFMNLASKELFKKIINLPEIAFEEKSVGELSNRIYNDPDKIIDTLGRLIKMISRLVAASIVVFISYKVSYIVTIELVIFVIVIYLLSNVYYPKIEKNQEDIKKLNDSHVKETFQILNGIREVKALGIKSKVYEIVKNNVENLFTKQKEQRKTEYMYNYLILLAYLIFETITLGTVAYLFFIGNVTFEIFIMMEMYIWRIDDAVESISDFGINYKKVIVSLKRMDEIVNNRLYNDEIYGTKSLFSKGNISFNNIKFCYTNKDYPVLNNLNLNIIPNKKIAIVGKSGQGKSTLFNLLLRYFDNYDGDICIDNINIKDLTEESLRNNISIIRQNPYIFNKTIKENFEMVYPNIELKDIKSACKKACIDDYIESLPNKYNTLIGEGGVNLSGGQKQRLAIARTLIKNTKIILFDEATSALDNESQEYIKRTIDNLVKDHTIIIVAHRLSTIMDADIIYIIDEGKVLDKGNHNELMNRSKLYKNLYNPETAIV